MEPLMYERTRTAADAAGLQFERAVATFLLVWSCRRRRRFRLATNMSAAPRFDDVVLLWEDGDGDHLLLAQVTHKKNHRPSRSQMLGSTRSNKLSLLKYIKDYEVAVAAVPKVLEALGYAGRSCTVTFVLWTNTELSQPSNKHTPLQNRPYFPAVDQLVGVGGREEIFSEDDEDVVKVAKEAKIDRILLKKFLRDFKFFYGCTIEVLNNLVQKELQAALAASDRETRKIFKFLKKLIRTKWDSSTCLEALMGESNIWTETVHFRSNLFNQKYMGFSWLEVVFDQLELKKLRARLPSSGMLIVKADKGAARLTALKIHHALQDEPHLLVDATDLMNRRSEVLDLQRCLSWCRRLLIVLVAETEQELQCDWKALASDEHRLLVVSDCCKNPHLRDRLTMESLSADFIQRLRWKKVFLQGNEWECRLRELVPEQKPLQQLLETGGGGCFLTMLRPSPLNIGRSLDPFPPYYVSRTLSVNRYLKIGFFSSLQCCDVVLTDVVSYAQLRGVLGQHSLLKIDDKLRMEHTHSTNVVVVDGADRQTAQKYHSFHPNYNIFLVEYFQIGWKLLYSTSRLSKLRPYIDNTIDEHISQSDILEQVAIIQGKLGMGKSTLLYAMGNSLKEKHPSWIVHVKCRDLSSCFEKWDSVSNPIDEILQTCAKSVDKNMIKMEINILKNCLNFNENMTVLIDGFDEVSMEHTEKCLQLLTELIPKQGRLVVTTRPATVALLEDSLGVKAYTLNEFSDDELRDFLTRYSTTQRLTIELKLALINKQIREVLSIPLFAKIYAESTCVDHETNTMTLFDELLQKNFKRLFAQKYSADLSQPFLENLMLNSYIMHEEELMKMAVLALVKDEKVIREVGQPPYDYGVFLKVGIIYDVGQGKPLFVHRTFAEYYLAKWCLRRVGQWVCAAVYREAVLEQKASLFLELFQAALAQDSPLLLALLAGRWAVAESLLEAGADPAAVDGGGRGALHLAVVGGAPAALLADLCARGPAAAVAARDELLGWMPLRYAAELQHWAAVCALLGAAGADALLALLADLGGCLWEQAGRYVVLCNSLWQGDLGLFDDCGVHSAVSKVRAPAQRLDATEVMACLFFRDAKVNHRYDCKETTPHATVYDDVVCVVNRFLKDNEDATTRDEDDVRSWYLATRRGGKKMLDYLLKYGGETNTNEENSRTSLFYNSCNKSKKVVEAVAGRSTQLARAARGLGGGTAVWPLVKREDSCRSGAVDRLIGLGAEHRVVWWTDDSKYSVLSEPLSVADKNCLKHL